MSEVSGPGGSAIDAKSLPPIDLVWQSLSGPLALFAHRRGGAVILDAEVGIFGALDDQHDPAAWRALADLLGPAGAIGLFPLEVPAPPGWGETFRLAGVQIVGEGVEGRRRSDVLDMGAGDVDDVLDLVERTRPGPFARRTIELGGYVGLRDDGRLVALSGRRLATDTHVEVSAVCVDPDRRRGGLARVLVEAVVAGIIEEGRVPMLHAAASNTNAIALYEAMGFTISRRFDFVGVQAPAGDT